MCPRMEVDRRRFDEANEGEQINGLPVEVRGQGGPKDVRWPMWTSWSVTKPAKETRSTGYPLKCDDKVDPRRQVDQCGRA